jgi:hypothetical protein
MVYFGSPVLVAVHYCVSRIPACLENISKKVMFFNIIEKIVLFLSEKLLLWKFSTNRVFFLQGFSSLSVIAVGSGSSQNFGTDI